MTDDHRWRAAVAYAETLPPDATIPVAAGLVVELAGRLEAPPEAPAEFTVAQLAIHFGKSVSTVRSWCEAGLFPNAMKWRAEWRISRADVEAFREGQRERPTFAGRPVKPRLGATTELGAWRKRA